MGSYFSIANNEYSPLITLVIESPSLEDDAAHYPFSDFASTGKTPVAQVVWDVIDQLQIPRQYINVVPLVRCASRTGVKFTSENIIPCLNHLWDELRTYKPKVLVCMGLPVIKVLAGVSKLASARGMYGHITLPKKYPAVPDDLTDIEVTSTVSAGAAWMQSVTGTGSARSQLVEDLRSVWMKVSGTAKEGTNDFKWLETYEDIDSYFLEVERDCKEGNSPGVIVDIESNQMFDPWTDKSKLVAVGFCHKAGYARAVKVCHKDQQLFNNGGQPVWEAFCRRLQTLFDRARVGGWNLKFDYKWIKAHTGAIIQDVFFDGHLAHYLLYNMDGKKHDLKNAIVEELGISIPEAELHADMQRLKREGYAKEDIHMGNVDEDILLRYLCGDVDSTFRLYEHLDPMLDNDYCYKDEEYQSKYKGMSFRKLYTNLMLPCVLALPEIEENGIKVDPMMLDYLIDSYPDRLKLLFDPIREFPAAQEVLGLVIADGKPEENLVSSYVYLSKLFYEVIKFPTVELKLQPKTRKTKSGDIQTYYPTGKPIREQLTVWAVNNNRPDLVKLINDISAYKKATKLYTSYVTKIHGFMGNHGYLRTNYNIGGTTTGRASTSSPSLHILPKKSDLKKIFKSRWHEEGGVIMQADFSQLEMRVVAALAKEDKLINIFKSGVDTHRQMAAKLNKKAEEDVTAEERDKGKTISFGVLYGMQAESMAAKTGLTKEECVEKIGNFFDEFPHIAKWMKKQYRDAKKRAVIRQGTGRCQFNPKLKLYDPTSDGWEIVDYQFDQYGYITTEFGRKRILQEANHWKSSFAAKAERKAFNTPVQGTASDIALEALIRIFFRLKKEKLQSKLFGWIHDSIEIDTHPTEIFQVYTILKEEMEEMPSRLHKWLNVPLKVSFEVGHGWGYMVEIKNMDTTTRKLVLEGDGDNVNSVVRALGTVYNTSQINEEIEKNGKVVGIKATIQC